MRMLRAAAGGAVVLLLAGCFLISAQSEFAIRNASTYPLMVSWGTLDHGPGSLSDPVAVGETVVIAAGRLLEADDLPPSLYFSSLQVSVQLGETWTVVYDPETIVDAEWTAQETGYHRHTHTLTLDNEHLAIP